jgi:hypothetical protein
LLHESSDEMKADFAFSPAFEAVDACPQRLRAGRATGLSPVPGTMTGSVRDRDSTSEKWGQVLNFDFFA